MNRSVILLAAALCLPFTARADDASHRAKAEQVITLLRADKTVEQASENVSKEVSEAADKAVGANPTPEKKAKLEDFETKAHQVIEQQLGWKSMQAAFTDIYVKAFTEEQLDAIITFYKSPAGEAMLTNMPSVNSQFVQLGQSRLAAVQAPLQQLYASFKQSLAAPAPGAGPTSTSPSKVSPK